MRTRRTLVALAAASLGLAACGGSTKEEASPTTAATASPSPASTAAGAPASAFNDADVTFAQGMIPHHEGAIEMADIALDPAIGASPQVQELSRQIKAAQDPEIKQLAALLTSWGKPMAMDMSADQMAAMDGMMSAESMDALNGMKGAEFDKAWAQMMVEHHKGAIAMAQTVKAAGANPEILALADAVIAGQQAELVPLQLIASS